VDAQKRTTLAVIPVRDLKDLAAFPLIKSVELMLSEPFS